MLIELLQRSPVAAASDLTCPSWCRSHCRSMSYEDFHQFDLAKSWGDDCGERVTLALHRSDAGDLGDPSISVQYTDGGSTPVGAVPLSLSDAKDFVLALSDLIARAEAGKC